MATGIVIGLSRHRDGWGSTSQALNAPHQSTGLTKPSLSNMSPTIHHRSYSDVRDNLDRPRLPSISNFLEGAGRPDLSYSSTSSRRQEPSPYSTRPAPRSSDSASWSPGNDVRPLFQKDPSQPYKSPTSLDTFIPINETRPRPDVALPPLMSPDTTDYNLYSARSRASDAMSPDSRTTAKTVIREDIVPGKGMCYVYDDGSVCQKVINGDTVNPKWGTTKAGKPRKRLGQACNTCREKKIKCDPCSPKCTQCQKFGRECRFEAPSRASHKSPKLRSEDLSQHAAADEHSRTRRASVALTETSSHSESGTIFSRPAGTVDDPLSPQTSESNLLSDAPGPSKKVRLSTMDLETPSDMQTRTPTHDSYHTFSLDVDPFKVNKKMTEMYLSAYLTHVNSSTFSLVPKSAFLRWAEQEEDKSPVSKLVLYCMLAVGCIFAKNADRTLHEQHFASIALEGVLQSFGHFSLQLIQARLIFALYEFHSGQQDRAWDLCGAAIRTASAMKLNTEEGIAQRLHETGAVYELDKPRLAECMRRTFWTAFIMERFGAACLGFTTTVNTADCFLRLPCTRQAYEMGNIPQTSFFDGTVHPVRHSRDDQQTGMGILAYMVQIASLCCDVHTHAQRIKHRTLHGREKRSALERDDLEHQLRAWESNYAAHIASKTAQRSPLDSSHGFSFGGLHIMYHFACMQLHRHIYHAALTRGQIAEHVKRAYHHAEKTLQIAEQLTTRSFQDIRHYDFAASSPLSGYAVLAAIDVLTAAGLNAKLLERESAMLEMLLGSVQLLDGLTENWASAKTQQRLVSERIQLVIRSAQAGNSEGKIAFCVSEPIAAPLGREDDLVYGIDRMQYLEALGYGDSVHHPSDVVQITSRTRRADALTWKD